MAAAGATKDLCDEATCPICLELFTNLVTFVRCGHNFCRACLSQYWEKEEDTAASCPQCRGTVPDRSFVPNRPLVNVAEISKKLRLLGQGGPRKVAEGVCKKHQEPLKLFCRNHQAPICVVCDRSKEHRHHTVVPREEAFQEYKDIGRTLQRSEKKEAFQNPAAFPPELNCRIGNFNNANPLLESVMQQFPAIVTLDPDTAHRKLVLSEDGKSVRQGEYQVLPENPERFQLYLFVLGREGFTSGRHFWEVTVVVNKGNWAVGAARKSVTRKGGLEFSPKGGIWAVGMWGGHYQVFASRRSIPLSLGQEPKRIRVTLNCAEGQVGFSDADTGVHLYTFSGALFRGETLLPFFFVSDKGHLRLSP